MSKEDLKVQVTLTSPVRVSWPEVIEPKLTQIPGVPSKSFFSARFVFPADHPDITGLRQTGANLLHQLRPDLNIKAAGLVAGKDFWWPFKSGEKLIEEAKARAAKKGKDYKGFEDYMVGTITLYAKAYAEYPPQLDVFENGKYIKIGRDPSVLARYKSKFFNGMNAVGSVTLAANHLPTGGWGISCYLNGLAALGGEKIGGVTEVSYDYVPTVTGASTTVDPTDDIPFN
jgi:hypothetical protein